MTSGSRPRIGVLALQGDVREHLVMLAAAGAEPRAVRRARELADVEALVIPGGESTTMWRLARIFDLEEPIRDRLAEGMPALGTCAGMIMLANRLVGDAIEQPTFGGLDIAVRRNAFGRQVDSFETEVDFAGCETPLPAVFIRAPWVEEVGSGVAVLATVSAGSGGERAGRIVAVRQGPVMATSFHPEVTGDERVHRYFVDLVMGHRLATRRPARHGRRETLRSNT